MNEGIVRYTSRLFSRPVNKRKQPPKPQDYRSRLWSSPSHETRVPQTDESCPYADRVRGIVVSLQGSLACQSVAVTVVQTLEGILRRERAAANAAISLGQSERLEEMVRTSESTLYALAEALNAQGSHLMNLFNDVDPSHPEENSWWFALSETLEAVENGIKRILSLASTQPKGGAARQLSTIIVQLLRSKQRELLSEADAWIS